MPLIDFVLPAADERVEILESELAKLRRINAALMDRVERSIDLEGSPFSLFQASAARGWPSMMQDVVERHRAALTLERRVSERTKDLTRANDALMQARLAAESANIAKTRFLAGASHDLLQPLSAARLFVAALGERRLAEPSRLLVGQIESALSSIEDLLEALLEISQLDAGAVQPHRANFPVMPLLSNLQAEFTPQAQSRGILLRIQPCAVTINSDVRLLRRILQNFISNAIRYTTGPEVTLRGRPCAGGFRLEVLDTGPGIARDKHGAVFDEFVRLDEHAHGLGLGLAIVKRAGKALGHAIHLRSAPGKGSVFGITVPFGQIEGRCDGAKAGPSNQGAFAGVRLLVIHDDPALLGAIAALLGSWSCEVATAANIDAAIRQVDEGLKPQAIIANAILGHGGPGQGGLDRGGLGHGEKTGVMAVHALRLRLGWRVPAIIATPERTPEAVATILAQGCLALAAPVRPASLRALLARLVKAA